MIRIRICTTLQACIQLNSNLTLARVSLASTCKFSKTTCGLDASTQTSLVELMKRDIHKSLPCTLNHSSRVLK